MTDRKIILKCQVGSHLYGTNTPESDLDYSGIFMPSTEDMLGLQNCPTEWSHSQKFSHGPRNTAQDTDCKYYSLQRFLNLAAQGQPGQLEMLFAPTDNIEHWDTMFLVEIRNVREMFLSKRGIQPFIGFALSQAHKATIKGDNLNKLRTIKLWGISLTPEQKNAPIISHMAGDYEAVEASLYLAGQKIDSFTNDHGAKILEIAGRKYDRNLRTKVFLENISELIERYGARSEAAAQQGHDYKSLMHAYRLLSEAQEFLLTGHITFPRPDADFLKQVRRGEYEADHFDQITKKLDQITQEILPMSKLPEMPDRGAINQLCIDLHRKHLLGTT